MIRRPPRATRTDTLFPYTTLFRSRAHSAARPLSPRLSRNRRLPGLDLRRPSALDESQHRPDLVVRSEEHTSELQSLMRISYAVFCLKKKTLEKQKTHS